jgi:hypothetical protein
LTTIVIADVPFARLDVILLLIKNHLKGRIPDMLNDKDNQVFMDYLAGGRSKQVEKEREANAQSGGVLSVAARNLAVVTEGDNMLVDEDAKKDLEDVKHELQAVALLAKEVQVLPETFKQIQKEFAGLAETKLMYGKKEHDQKLQFKREETELDVELEQKKKEFELQRQELELKKRKENMQLLLEEAEVEQRCKAIREGRIDVIGNSHANESSSSKKQKLLLPARTESSSSGSSGSSNDSLSSGWTTSSCDEDVEDKAKEDATNTDLFDYDASKEAGLTPAEVKQRRDMWNKLADLHNFPHNDDWLSLVGPLTAAKQAYEMQLLQRIAKYEMEQETEQDAKAARRAYIKTELNNSKARLKQFRACQYLHLCRKVLGEEAWEDCVDECSVNATVDDSDDDIKQVNWTNMEIKLFGVNVHKTQHNNWKAKFGNAQFERTLAQSLDEQIVASEKKNLDGLKERLKMARWRFGMCVVEGMQCRMREMHVRRRMLEMTRSL